MQRQQLMCTVAKGVKKSEVGKEEVEEEEEEEEEGEGQEARVMLRLRSYRNVCKLPTQR